MVELGALYADAEAHFPLAVTPSDHLLPDAPPFVHAIAGLVQLADWIGSSEWRRDRSRASSHSWVTDTLRTIGLDPASWRTDTAQSAHTFASVFGKAPYTHQLQCGVVNGNLVILEAETGSGKTEAALWRFLRLFEAGEVDGMYFALPTRTAAAQLHQRVASVMQAIWPDDTPPTVMAVPGYLDDAATGGLPDAADPLDKPEGDERTTRVWASEHPKRFFSAMIGVGTIDQALLAALRVTHAHLRASCLMRHLLVVDEVHASDAYMQRLLQQLLRDHLAAGGHALLLSATLGAESRQATLAAAAGGRSRDDTPLSFRAASTAAYPLISVGRADGPALAPGADTTTKSVSMTTQPWLDEPHCISQLALSAARRGAKVLVVRNTVGGAVAVQRALEAAASSDSSLLFSVAGRPTLHHGRFAREDRRQLDRQVETLIGRRDRPQGGIIIVGTQTLEQSLDIDADYLVTDLCPVDVLLQRIGRLHRHRSEVSGAGRERPEAYAQPQCVVLVPTGGLADFLPPTRRGPRERHGLGHTKRHGVLQGVYEDLTVLEATRQLLVAHGTWIVPQMNRLLVESGIHSEAINALIEGMPEGERAAWEAHRMDVEGHVLAQMTTAAGGLLRRDRDFMSQGVDDAAHVATRLGAGDRLLSFPVGTVGPFGALISRISIPNWLLDNVPADAVLSVTRTDSGNGLDLGLGERSFRYDTHGLQQVH
jgi:CRISPR-associated endonuclease/helicase Cas3